MWPQPWLAGIYWWKWHPTPDMSGDGDNLGFSPQFKPAQRLLKQTFTITPIAAVAGSLVAQWVLDPKFSFLEFPYDFAAIY